jgi:hypothetical protein
MSLGRIFALTLVSLGVQAASSAPVGYVPFTGGDIRWPDETSDTRWGALPDPAQAGNAFRLPFEDGPATMGDLLASTGVASHRSLGLIPTIAPDQWLEGLTPVPLELGAFGETSSSAAADSGLGEFTDLAAAAEGQVPHSKQWGSSRDRNHAAGAGGNHASSRPSRPLARSAAGDHGERNYGERDYGKHYGALDNGALDNGALVFGGNYGSYTYGESVTSLPLGSFLDAAFCSPGTACRNPVPEAPSVLAAPDGPSALATPEPSLLVLFGLSIAMLVPFLWRTGWNKGDKSHPFRGLLPVAQDPPVMLLPDPLNRKH